MGDVFQGFKVSIHWKTIYGGVTTIKFFKNWGHITLEVVFCLYIRKLNVWRFQGFKDSKKWKTNIVESPPKGFSNFESHITVERVLYLYYPASCVTFSKGLRFKVIEKQTRWSHHQLQNTPNKSAYQVFWFGLLTRISTFTLNLPSYEASSRNLLPHEISFVW